MENSAPITPSWISMPLALMEDDRLTDFERILLSFIGNLSQSEGYCYACNDYLSDKLKRPEKTIRNAISKLKGFGLIQVDNFNKSIGTNRKLTVSMSQIRDNEQTNVPNTGLSMSQIRDNVIKDEIKTDIKTIGEPQAASAPTLQLSETSDLTYDQKLNSTGVASSNLNTTSTSPELNGGAAKKRQRPKPLTEQELYNALVPFVDQYTAKTIREFYDYWTEKSGTGTCRYQEQKFFEIPKRLATWKRKESNYSTPQTNQTSTVYVRPQTLPAV